MSKQLGPLTLEISLDRLPFVDVGDNVACMMTRYRVTRVADRIVYLRRAPLKLQYFMPGD